MESGGFKLDLNELKHDLIKGIHESSQRGLTHTVKWLAELNHTLSHISLAPDEYPDISNGCGDETETYLLAKSYFDLKEYDRSAYFTKDCASPTIRFLHLYARYLSIEKKKLDNMTDKNCPPDPTKNTDLRELCTVLKNDSYENKLDGYCLYLYGIILRKLDLGSLAIEVFAQAVNAAPLIWGAWQELGQLIPDRNAINTLHLPDHWMKHFFLAHMCMQQLNNDEALQIYYNLQEQGFTKSSYILAQMAMLQHNCRDVEKAIETFQEVLSIDPCRLDNLDTYSNLLYVSEMKKELADLAHTAVSIDKYRVETCCVIGNYYSLRSDHAKAVLYFRRALKLNPSYLSAWTLMGHEFMEMKNTNAAIQSYRHAIEINNRDYRAWYGLGQTYEILKMPLYCLYYYKQAQQLRPNDSRMIIAVGETYEKLEKIENALKCYYKACKVGDIEGTALIKLAKLYDKLNEPENAAAAFTDYCLQMDERKDRRNDEQVEFYNAFQYLANYYLKKGELDDAYSYAYKCLEYDGVKAFVGCPLYVVHLFQTKEQAKALLKTIAATRGEQELEPVPMDETGPNISRTNDASTSNIDMVLSPNT